MSKYAWKIAKNMSKCKLFKTWLSLQFKSVAFVHAQCWAL